MDWFYPVITGWVQGQEAIERIDGRWSEFVEPGLGCRCEVQEPWVTVAESCELTMALLSVDNVERAQALFDCLWQWRDEVGVFWTGYQFEEDVLWPLEKPTWISGAVLLAADALSQYTTASRLFTDVDSREQPKLERRHLQA